MWVMSTRKMRSGIDVCIGNVLVASVVFTPQRGGAALILPATVEQRPVHECASVADAFRLLHELLKSPPPEGFKLPEFARKTTGDKPEQGG